MKKRKKKTMKKSVKKIVKRGPGRPKKIKRGRPRKIKEPEFKKKIKATWVEEKVSPKKNKKAPKQTILPIVGMNQPENKKRGRPRKEQLKKTKSDSPKDFGRYSIGVDWGPGKDKSYPEKLRVGYFGMGGNTFLVTQHLLPILQKCNCDLFVCSEWDMLTNMGFTPIKWNPDIWVEEMLSMDVILCPQREGIQDAKSNIKATVAMALGMPVICSKIPSYKEIIQNGENGFLASIHHPQEWENALEQLKDPMLRLKMGQAGRESIRGYSVQNIAKRWIDTLNNLSENSLASSYSIEKKENKEPIDLIIATYNNLEYIKLTITSIQLNTDHPYRIILSDAGSDKYVWDYFRSLQGFVILGEQGKRLNYSQACNAGIIYGNSKYFCIMNSDLIVSSGWLTAMVDKMEKVDRLAACGPLSNCDSGWLWNTHNRPQVDMMDLHPGMKINQIGNRLGEIYSFMKQSNETYKRKYVAQEWIAAYCTLYARSAFNEVGFFDNIFENGCEDLDHCIRLRKHGYEIGQAMDAFVFHFGGISRGAYQQENVEKYNLEDKENHKKLAAKWSKKKIAIYCGPAWEKWSRKKVDEGMAGSETWASYLAAEFSKKGYQVFIFNDCEQAEIDRDGVIYYPHLEIDNILRFEYLDAFIASRTCDVIGKVRAEKNYVMIHDIWLSQDKNYNIQFDKVDKYICLSEWHKSFLMEHHRIPENKLLLISNGVNDNLYSYHPLAMDFPPKKNYTVWSSSPDRGLLQLLKILPSIRKEIPDFRIIVCYGFDNWEKASNYPGREHEKQIISEIKSLMAGPGVNYLGRIDKKSLATLQKEAKVWLYPTWFTETFCITAVENGMAKNPIITSNLAGLKTTVGEGGVLIDGDIRQPDIQQKFIELTVAILKQDNLHSELSKKAYDKMKGYTWSASCERWLEEINA